MSGATLRRWKHATYPECRGWRDEGNAHHRCDQDDPTHHYSGRCRACHGRSEAAKGRRVAKSGQAMAARVDPDAARAIERLNGPPPAADPPAAPSAARALDGLLGGDPGFTGGAESAAYVRAGRGGGADGDFAWTLFDVPRRHTAADDEPVVTLHRDGDCRLNAAAWRLAGEPVAIEVLYDATRRAVALRPCDAGARAARLLRIDRKSQARTASLRAFRRAVDWFPAATVRLTPRRVGPLLVLELAEGVG